MRSVLAIGLMVACFSFSASASDEKEFLEFFERYQLLGKNFDVAVADLYSENAKVMAVQTLPDGTEQILKFEGKRWKEIITDTMEGAKKRGDTGEYSKVRVQTRDTRAKIMASRYSTFKCFHDDDYYMVVKKQPDGTILIVEESFASIAKSACVDPPKNELASSLEGAATLLNKQLPMMVDADTKLEKVSSKGDVLTMHYEIVSIAAVEVDAKSFIDVMKPIVVQQTCVNPTFKSIVDQGGTVSYLYRGKLKQRVAAIEVNGTSCQ